MSEGWGIAGVKPQQIPKTGTKSPHTLQSNADRKGRDKPELFIQLKVFLLLQQVQTLWLKKTFWCLIVTVKYYHNNHNK